MYSHLAVQHGRGGQSLNRVPDGVSEVESGAHASLLLVESHHLGL